MDGTSADGSPFATEVTFSVTAAAAAQADADSNDDDSTAELALTGSSSSRTALNGALIIAAGVALVFFASRRKEEPLITTDA